ncbi:MAG: hypothetical protein ACJAR2_003136 [Ilumatobacter sp.]|jgi:hypothetical protein
METRPCGAPHPTEHIGRVEMRGRRVGAEEFDVIGPESVVAVFCDVSSLSGELGSGACQTNDAALGEVAVDALLMGDPTDLVHCIHDLLGESHAVRSVAGSELRERRRCAETTGEFAQTPATVEP